MDAYSPSVSHFVYCFSGSKRDEYDKSKASGASRSGTQSDGLSLENGDGIHIDLLQRALKEQKQIMSIEHILSVRESGVLTPRVALMSINAQAQTGYSIEHQASFDSQSPLTIREGESQSIQERSNIVIKDLTRHYKTVSLVRLRRSLHP